MTQMRNLTYGSYVFFIVATRNIAVGYCPRNARTNLLPSVSGSDILLIMTIKRGPPAFSGGPQFAWESC